MGSRFLPLSLQTFGAYSRRFERGSGVFDITCKKIRSEVWILLFPGMLVLFDQTNELLFRQGELEEE